MKNRFIKKDRAEKKGNRATIPIDIRMVKAGKVKPKEENVDNSTGDLEEHDTGKEYILFLIFLAVGMILQLMSNNYCVLTGTVVCISACGFICSWVFFSSVLSNNESNSFSRTTKFSD
jgi:hypothetical protein